jgi:hypothetical protein
MPGIQPNAHAAPSTIAPAVFMKAFIMNLNAGMTTVSISMPITRNAGPRVARIADTPGHIPG